MGRAQRRTPGARVPARRKRGRRLVLCGVLVVGSIGAASGAGRTDEPRPARTLVVALDGVPYRVVERARELGAFEGWPATQRLVSTFPSMTNVGFAAILEPLGASPMAGYELRHFDHERKRITGGGPIGYRRQAGNWRELFDTARGGLLSKVSLYLAPKRKIRKEFEKVGRVLRDEPAETMLALVSATDPLTHFRGDEATARMLVELSAHVTAWQQEHRERHGAPLHVVLLSDHGNYAEPVHTPGGIRKLLRRAGLRPRKRLSEPDDVVPVTYGVCNFGSLYLDRRNAETAARAVLGHPGVDLAAWVNGPGEIRVVSRQGEATVRWRERAGLRELAYDLQDGDPLRLEKIRAAMETAGLLDAEGFGTEEAWFENTALHEFPDPLARLVDALDGRWVTNAATVIFTLAPGYAWGLRTAQIGAWLLGAGPLAATHGGLDAESSWGFLLSSEPPLDSRPAVPAAEALRHWLRPGAELRAWGSAESPAAHGLHAARPGATVP